jgi:sulfate adenylyltransferase subunit 2
MNARVNPDRLLPELDQRHLDGLAEEANFILCEVAAPFGRPEPPFALPRVDTGHNFPEVIAFRDQRVAEMGERLEVGHLEDSNRRGTVRLAHPLESCNGHQTVTLLEAIEDYRFDGLIGGTRRDEEKARAKAHSNCTSGALLVRLSQD